MKDRNELKKSEERYRILLESTPIGIYYNDFSGRFLYGNQRAEEIIGYKKEELIGKNFLKLKILPVGQIKRAAKLLALNRMGKSTGPDEFTLIRKDGSKRDIISLANFNGGSIRFLNNLGCKVFCLCDGQHNVIDIIKKIHTEFKDIDSEEVYKDVFTFLNTLLENQIMEIVQNK